MDGTKVLFLDIDGVLNCDKTKEKISGVDPLYDGALGLDPQLVDRYLKWKKDRGFETILSSTWRLYEPLHKFLNDHGIFWIDITPRGLPWAWVGSREREIRYWLKHNTWAHWAAVDDLSFKCPHLVQTSHKTGLLNKHIKILDKYLGY